MAKKAEQAQAEEQAQDTSAEDVAAAKAAAIEAAFNVGQNAGESEDQIKIRMIQAGSTFRSVTKDYNDLLVKLGFVDSKETKDATIAEILKDADVSTEEGFNNAVAQVCASLKGVDDKSAAASIRWLCRKNEKPYWIKPKSEGTGRVGFAATFYAAVVANPRMTEAEADAIINGTDGYPATTENVQKNRSHYQGIRKLANAIMDISEASEEDDDE